MRVLSRLKSLVLFGVLAVSTTGAAESSSVPSSGPSVTRGSQTEPPVEPSPEEEESRLTKNWGGPRKDLSALGVDLALIYKGETVRNFSGGIRQDTTYHGNLDVRGSFDLEKLVGWKGGSAFVYFLGDHGGRPSEFIGDAQVTSNIETRATAGKLYEAWLQQLMLDDKVSILVGLHDLNSEFYVTETSGLFFNSSFGVGYELAQTGVNGPSIFPVTAPAIRLRMEPTKQFYAELGVFNGRSGDPEEPRGTHIALDGKDGALVISEAGFVRGRGDGNDHYGKYAIGTWYYTKTFDHISQSVTDASGNAIPVQATSRGLYFLSEQNFSETIAAFVRYGIASTEVNQFGSCLTAGIVTTGLIPGRQKDRFGVGVARVTNGSEYKDAQAAAGSPVDSAETTLEANYRFEAIPGLAIQPDLQYVMNPGTDPSLSNALVGAFRFELSF